MAKPKNTASLQSNVDPAIEAKVDAMMNTETTQTAATSGAPTAAQKPLDAFAGQAAPIEVVSADKPATAPLLPKARAKAEVPMTETEPTPESKPEPVLAAEEPSLPASQTAEDDITIEPLNIDTPQTDSAIADIVAQEADEVLAAQDAGITAAVEAVKETPEAPVKHGHPLFWFGVVLLVIIAIIAAWVLSSPGLNPSFKL